jgi:hypothetical protein
MVVSGTTAQVNFTNSQTFDIDIEQFYNDIITSIDQIRSHISIAKSAQVIQSMIQALANNSTTDPYLFIKKMVVDPKNPQETRCHAFYRLLGLPAVSPDGSLYSPGFDKSQNTLSNPNILQQHLNVINGINKAGLFATMDARETYINSILSIFSLSNEASGVPNINASVLALSSISGGNVRKFSSSVSKSSDPFDVNIFDQSYTIGNQNGQVFNSVNTALLTNYLGPDGIIPLTLLNKILPLQQSLLSTRAHLIKPFMVDPRSDFTINPPNGFVCAPFATDKSKTLYAQDIYLTRPYIETICRQRCNNFLNQNNQTSGQGAQSPRYQDLLDFIQNTSNVRNQDLLNSLAATPTQTVSDQVLLKYVNIMNSMVNKLSEAIKIVQNAEIEHQYIPLCDSRGPEFGSTTPDIYLIPGSNGATLDPIILQSYQRDQDIITYTAQIQLQNVNAQVQQPDLGNFAFQGAGSIPDDKSSEAFGNRLQDTLDTLIGERTDVCNKAGDALRTIEIIMGEFSGLGLCDILALFTALWTVDEQTLIYLLDDQAFERLYMDPTLRDSVVQSRYSANQEGEEEIDGKTALTNLETQIRTMYALMDKLYSDVHFNNTTGS